MVTDKVSPNSHLPPPDKVVFEATIERPAAAARGAVAGPTVFRVLRSTEIDAYEQHVSAAGVEPFGAAPGTAADTFAGTARKAAKLSLSAAKTAEFADMAVLVDSLTPEKTMLKLKPLIATDATSNRVKQEERNVKVRAFLYAASRETDNDFHLIVGRASTAKPPVYMTVEVSGLPARSSKAFAALKSTRDAYKSFFAAHMPGPTYDFYDPPIPVTIEGSLFFDMSHAQGGRPGPATLRPHMPTIWEIHPLSSIAFGA